MLVVATVAKSKEEEQAADTAPSGVTKEAHFFTYAETLMGMYTDFNFLVIDFLHAL